MTKVPAIKKIQSSPYSGSLWPFASELPSQVQEKPIKNIKYIDKEIVNLKKDLTRSRFLVKSVKIGRGYFAMLREENALKKRQQQLQKLREEERHKFQPAKKLSEIHYGDILLATYDHDQEKTKPVGAGAAPRPFTPTHSCIISTQLPEAHVEPLFRQLCALHWLLEALTIDHTHHTMKPLITCWNTKDPGGSKNTIKKINKDKSMGQRWEHFITATTPKKKFKIPAVRATGRKPSQRASMLSLSRVSAASSPQSSMVLMNPGFDEPPRVMSQVTSSKDIEDNDSSSTKPDDELLHVNLQKLLEMVREEARRTIMMDNGTQKHVPGIMIRQTKSESAYKDTLTTHKSSDRSISTSKESHSQSIQKKSKSRTNRDIIHCKSEVCNTMRAKFYSVAQEAAFCLQDKMEILMKRQEERGLQKFHSFVLASNFKKDVAKMRHQVPIVKGDADEIADHWYFDLLSKLPEDLKNFRPAKKILAKLQKFGENLDLRIRPHVLLKVLQDLRVWELCSPDIAVAIEFVREHIIHMPQEDYINWLQNWTMIPIRPHSAQT